MLVNRIKEMIEAMNRPALMISEREDCCWRCSFDDGDNTICPSCQNVYLADDPSIDSPHFVRFIKSWESLDTEEQFGMISYYLYLEEKEDEEDFRISSIDMQYFNQQFNVYAYGETGKLDEKMIFEKGNDRLYRQVTCSPFVRFFALGEHASMRDFDINLSDGTVEHVHGYAWSSRAGVINKYFTNREHVVEICFNGMHTAIKVSVMQEAMKRICPEFSLEKHVGRDGEIVYRVVKH